MRYLYDVDLIKDYVKHNELTVEEFCRKCDIKINVYKRIMKQDSNVKVCDIAKIAKVIDVAINFMFFLIEVDVEYK